MITPESFNYNLAYQQSDSSLLNRKPKVEDLPPGRFSKHPVNVRGSGIYRTGEVGAGIFQTGSVGAGIYEDLITKYKIDKDKITQKDLKKLIKKAYRRGKKKKTIVKKKPLTSILTGKPAIRGTKKPKRILKTSLQGLPDPTSRAVGVTYADDTTADNKRKMLIEAALKADIKKQIQPSPTTTTTTKFKTPDEKQLSKNIREGKDQARKKMIIIKKLKEKGDLTPKQQITFNKAEISLGNIMATLKERSVSAYDEIRDYETKLYEKPEETTGNGYRKMMKRLKKDENKLMRSGITKRQARKLILRLNGGGVATSILKPVLQELAPYVVPHVVSGIKSAISWIGKKIFKTGKGAKTHKGFQDSKNPSPLLRRKIAVMKTKQVKGGSLKSIFKTFKTKGIPVIKKIVHKLASDKKLQAKLFPAGKQDHGKTIMGILKVASAPDASVKKVAHKVAKEIGKKTAPMAEEPKANEGSGIKKISIKKKVK